MGLPTPAAKAVPARRFPLFPLLVLVLGVVVTAVYVNQSFRVTHPENYRFFPPFVPGFDRNMNTHLGAEYFSIAKALYTGRGFADPFQGPSGPTAWMPPVFPALLAALLWVNDGDVGAVMNAIIVIQAVAVVLVGVLVLVLARRVAMHNGPWWALAAFVAFVLGSFTLAFQQTHDCWLVLLVLTGVLAGPCLGRPMGSVVGSAGWGLWGGLAALVSPVVGFVWGVLTIGEAIRCRTLVRLLLAGVGAAVVLTPWTVRNYQTFGRFIPVKSNLGYELHQSQCRSPDGLLRLEQFLQSHPYNPMTPDSRAYRRLGEMAFLDQKMAAFRASVSANPGDFAAKVGNRFLAATLVYVPTNPTEEERVYWALWISRVLHPLPFLAVVLLVGTACRFGLRREQWVVLLGYTAYLLPYILVGYYDRYAYPLIGVKTILVVWAAERLIQIAARGGRTPSGTSELATAETPSEAPAVMPPVSRWMWHRWVLGLLLTAGLWWCYGTAFMNRLSGPVHDRVGNTVIVPDFFQEWYSARLWLEGRPIYESQLTGKHHLHLPPEITGHFFVWNAHPPGAVLLALPFGSLDFASALLAWNELSLLAFGVAVVLVVSRLGCPIPLWLVPLAVTAGLLSNPFWTQVTHGQLNTVLLLLFVVAWVLDRSGCPGWSGAVIGVAAIIKLFPACLLLYFVLRGRWRGLLGGALSIGGGLVVTSAVLGWDVWPVYLTKIVPETKEFATVWVNASVPGFWLKLFDPAKPWFVFHPWPIVSNRNLATAFTLVTALGLVALAWWRTRAGRSGSDPDTCFSAVVVLTLLLSPTTWDHYFLLLLLPFVVLMQSRPSGWPQFWIWAVVAALSVTAYRWAEMGMLLVGVSADWSKGGWESPPWLTATVLSIHTYALLALLGLLLFGVPQCPARNCPLQKPLSR